MVARIDGGMVRRRLVRTRVVIDARVVVELQAAENRVV
jgi:hypothetical protein